MILVATGLKREAEILGGPSIRAIAGGGDGQRLERELDDAAGQASAVISMGLCGALATGLKPGDWIVASGVVRSNDDMRQAEPTDPAWAAALLKRLPGARAVVVLASDRIIANQDAKRDAHRLTGASAVDMESHIAGRIAAKHGLPFAVARVVSDAADQSLPLAVQAGMAADGRMDIAAVLKSLAGDPRQLPALLRVAWDAGPAFRALHDGRRLIGPSLGYADR